MMKMFRSIIRFFDKWLITPITKLIIFIGDILKNNGKEVEKFINKKQTLIVISLVIAFGMFFWVDQNSDKILNKNAEILTDRPVIAEYNKEAYVIEGLPTSVDVTLIGRTADLYLAKQYASNLTISVDLRGLTPGSHKVKLKYNQNQTLKTVDYKLDPSTANIVVYEKVSETRELDYDVVRKDKLDSKLVLETIDLERNDIIIKGASYKLKQVANVKALVDVDKINNPKVGNYTLKDIPLVAYDDNGDKVDVEIVPSTVEATLKIASPSKEVPIQVIPTGDVAFGKSINTLTPSISKVTIYGDSDVLESINSIPVEIDVNGLTGDKTFNVNIDKPAGIREISARTVSVKVVLSEETTKEISNVKLSAINLADGLKAQAASKEDGILTVVVKGSKDLIETLDENTVKATVDLSGYTAPGEYEVDLVVSGDDIKLTYESKVKKVKILISESK